MYFLFVTNCHVRDCACGQLAFLFSKLIVCCYHFRFGNGETCLLLLVRLGLARSPETAKGVPIVPITITIHKLLSSVNCLKNALTISSLSASFCTHLFVYVSVSG